MVYKRGIETFLISVLLIGSIFVSMAYGDNLANPTVSISPASQSVEQGNDFCIEVHINSDGETVRSAGFQLTYHTSFTVKNFTYENLLGTNVIQMGIPAPGNNSGLINYAVSRTDGGADPENGVFATICLTAPGTLGGPYVLDLDDVILLDGSSSPIPGIVVTDGAVTVTGPPSIVYVDDDYNASTPGWGYDRFDRIQYGINEVNESGTVYVYYGIYYENVVINKTINIFGEGVDNVVVDGKGNDTIVINATGMHLSNFTLRDSLCHGMRIEGTHNVIDTCHICDIEGSCWGVPCGIWLLSPYNTIHDCIISDNNCSGIIISSYNNTISSCNISNNTNGIYLGFGSASNNTIICNHITTNAHDGIILLGSSSNYNTITENNIDANTLGIDLITSSNNAITGNTITNSTSEGISIGNSCNNIINGNIIKNNNYCGIFLVGHILNNSSTHHNTITGNLITNNTCGVYLFSETTFFSCNNNTLMGNAITNNDDGIWLSSNSDNNKIYHNNFNNSYNAYDFGNNKWDNVYPSGGNYWSNYTGIDTNGDGIGETPYNISGGHNQDRYPFVNPLLFMDLPQGWNLITVPFNNTWTAETLGQNISGCTVVCLHNATSQTYTTHVVGIPYNDFVIEDGVGYFIYVSYDSFFTLRDVPISSVNVSIDENWNIVGWCHDYPTIASSLGENITNCTVVCMFNASSQSYITHVVNIPYNDFLIERSMALFIFATESSYWQGEG